MALPDIAEMEGYIRQVAQRLGINPDIAVRVAQSEGLKPGVWQSNIQGANGRERSYGPFQLYEGGGLGNAFKNRYGVSASDPNSWKQQVDFSLGEALRSGWTPWHGAKRVGIGNFEGIRGGAAGAGPSTPPTAVAGQSAQPYASSAPVYSNGININPGPAPAYNSYSPSQGPGPAQKLSFWDRLKSNAGGIGALGDALSGGGQKQEAPVPPIGPPTGYGPLQVAPTSYTAQNQDDPVSLLRKLGLV
jgi:hypothetical protein